MIATNEDLSAGIGNNLTLWSGVDLNLLHIPVMSVKPLIFDSDRHCNSARCRKHACKLSVPTFDLNACGPVFLSAKLYVYESLAV